MSAFLEFLLACPHRSQTRAFTLRQRCYTVCLDCGRELPYSWVQMRTLNDTEHEKVRPLLSEPTSEAAWKEQSAARQGIPRYASGLEARAPAQVRPAFRNSHSLKLPRCRPLLARTANRTG
jgi:hypothetical protein